jgi:hypothetical protein
MLEDRSQSSEYARWVQSIPETFPTGGGVWIRKSNRSHRTALEQYYQAEARRYQPSSGFAYNGPFGGLFGSAF